MASLLSHFDTRVIRTAFRRSRGGLSGPRIAFVGNCQCPGLAYAAKLLRRDAIVDHFPILLGSRTPASLFVKFLQRYDFVFCHEFHGGYLGGGDSSTLRHGLRNITMAPSIAFSGYHPDLVYAHDKTRNGFPCESPTGYYHSALVIHAFLVGHSIDETCALFTRKVFNYVGYLDVWPQASKALAREGVKFDLNLDDAASSWARRGVFMHSLNHPKSFVLYDLAKRLLTKVGLETYPEDVSEYMPELASEGEIFPLYPEIASTYCEKGVYLFRDRHHNYRKGDYKFYDLRGFVEASFALYGKLRPEQFYCERVAEWQSNAALVARLTASIKA